MVISMLLTAVTVGETPQMVKDVIAALSAGNPLPAMVMLDPPFAGPLLGVRVSNARVWVMGATPFAGRTTP